MDSLVNNMNTNEQLNQEGTYDKLNQLFTDQEREQKAIREARDILGTDAENLTDAQIADLANEVQFLVDSWLEEFEKSVFDGKTLIEVFQLG